MVGASAMRGTIAKRDGDDGAERDEVRKKGRRVGGRVQNALHRKARTPALQQSAVAQCTLPCAPSI